MMKPVLNLDDVEDFQEHSAGHFAAKFAPISNQIGAQKLSFSISVVPPGKRLCPFHSHRINEEMFLILEGSGTLRFGDKEYPIKRHDIISCPPGGQELAHQIINTGDSDIRYLSLSTNEPHDICEYPDSKKMIAMSGPQGNRKFSHISKFDDAVSYMDGELES